MKRKVLLLVLVVFLISILAGCESHFLDGMDDEGIVEQIVYDYWMAIMNRKYELAKWDCCIPGEGWDHKTDELEECINANSEGECSFLMIYFDKFYKPTEIIEDNAVVYARIITDNIVLPCKKMDGLDIYIFEYETELIKQNYPYGNWELK